MGGVTHATTLPGRDGLIRPLPLLRAHRDGGSSRSSAPATSTPSRSCSTATARGSCFCRGMLRRARTRRTSSRRSSPPPTRRSPTSADRGAAVALPDRAKPLPEPHAEAAAGIPGHARRRPDTNGASTEEHAQQREDLRDLVANIRDLPEAQRSALLMRELENLSYKQIAASLETTVPAVKSLLVRARVTLAEAGRRRYGLRRGPIRARPPPRRGSRLAPGPARRHTRRCRTPRFGRPTLHLPMGPPRSRPSAHFYW